jgi:hypothetical protein
MSSTGSGNGNGQMASPASGFASGAHIDGDGNLDAFRTDLAVGLLGRLVEEWRVWMRLLPEKPRQEPVYLPERLAWLTDESRPT